MVSERFQSSFRAVLRRFQDNFKQCNHCAKPLDFKSISQTVSMAFQSNFRAVSLQPQTSQQNNSPPPPTEQQQQETITTKIKSSTNNSIINQPILYGPVEEYKSAGVAEWAAGKGSAAPGPMSQSTDRPCPTGRSYPKGCGPPGAPPPARGPAGSN